MRKTLVAAAVATVFSAGAFLASGANAMTLTTPAGMRLATEGVTPAEQVRYVCYRVRRHGGWRRVCSWRPNRVVVAPAYGYGYYGSPYYYGPTVGIGLGYGWGGGGWGWGGHRTVVHRHVHRGHHHGGHHRGHRR